MDFLFFQLIWPIIILSLLFFFIKRKYHSIKDKESLLILRDDTISQLIVLISLLLFGISILAINRNFNDPVSWKIILLALSGIGFYVAYRLKVLYVLIASLFGLSFWWLFQSAEWTEIADTRFSGEITGLVFLLFSYYFLGRWQEKNTKIKRFGNIFSLFSILSLTTLVFEISTREGLGLIEVLTEGGSVLDSWQLLSSLFILFSIFILTGIAAIKRKSILKAEIIAIAVLVFLFSIINFIPEQEIFSSGYYYYPRELSDTGMFWAALFNLIIFLQLVGIILLGYVRREKLLINLGTVLLFILITIKYFDWFFTFLDRSIFFIFAGIFLFIVGWSMEKGRRYMLKNIKS